MVVATVIVVVDSARSKCRIDGIAEGGGSECLSELNSNVDRNYVFILIAVLVSETSTRFGMHRITRSDEQRASAFNSTTRGNPDSRQTRLCTCTFIRAPKI